MIQGENTLQKIGDAIASVLGRLKLNQEKGEVVVDT
jgi:hypothetical protein